MRLYNTLTRQVEPFETIEPGVVRMYSCGPTVYRFAHIGNLRSYLMADWLRRTLLRETGLMREGFRFYRNLDLDFSFQFRHLGYHILALPGLPIKRYEHAVWSALSPQMQDQLSRMNFRRFQRKWGRRRDLLVMAA